MAKSWILVANASKAQLYEAYRSKLLHGDPAITLVDEFSHPQSRLKCIELVSDQPGHSRNGTLVEAAEPKSIEAGAFAKELANCLEIGRQQHLFDDLMIIASPPFHGVLNKCLSNHVKTLLSVSIEKDYTSFNSKRLTNNLQNYL